jgi:ABC-type Fe3+-hydroxamate transport system substrate-binding protein
MKKLALILSLVMVLTCMLSACGEKESGGISINAGTQTSSDTQIVSGLNGESYTLSNNITKIVSVSPAASIIIDNLGGSSKLTAVDKTSASYVTASSTVDASGAAGLSPEVIFVDEADKDSVGSTDIPVFVIPQATSVADINNLIRLCAKVLGVSADDAVSKVTNVMNVAQMNTSSYTTKYSAYIDMNGETVGSGTYVTELLHASGLENVCTSDGFCTMSDDEIIAANPEFIFTCGDVNDYLNNAAYADVAAVANNHVYSIELKDIRYGSNNITNVVSIMNEAVSSIRGDE